MCDIYYKMFNIYYIMCNIYYIKLNLAFFLSQKSILQFCKQFLTYFFVFLHISVFWEGKFWYLNDSLSFV